MVLVTMIKSHFRILGIIAAGILCGFTLWTVSRPAHHVSEKADKLSVSPLIARPVRSVRVAAEFEQLPLSAPVESSSPAATALLGQERTLDEIEAITYPEKPATAAPRTARPAVADICARSGGRKITTHGGRRWHCLYSRR
jgi:hypothetical protein